MVFSSTNKFSARIDVVDIMYLNTGCTNDLLPGMFSLTETIIKKQKRSANMKKRIIVITVTAVLLGVLVWLSNFVTKMLFNNNELDVLRWWSRIVTILAGLVILGIAWKNMPSDD